MHLRNSNGIEVRKFYFTTIWKFFFRKFSLEVENCIMWGSIQVLPNQVSEKLVDLRKFHAKLHKKPSEILGADSTQRLEISIYCDLRSFKVQMT